MNEPVTPPPPSSTPPPPPPAGGGESSNRTLMLVLAYMGILALVPLLVEKNDREVQWHAKHGLVLTVFWIVLFIVLGVLGAVPFLGCLSIVVSLVLPLGILVIHIICIVKAVKNERFTIPGISDFADKINI